MAESGDVFVDVTYRGIEVGRRLKLREVGPSTAYLEHGTPMPVGAELVLATEEGHAVPVVVLRVHEQVAGADMPPGMRVRATGLTGAAGGWWRALLAREDPQIPEVDGAQASPPAPEPRAVTAPAEAERAPIVAPPEDDEHRPTQVMMAVAPPDEVELPPSGGNGERRPETGSRTMQMSAQEIQDAIGGDPTASGEGTDPGTPSEGGNGEGEPDDQGARGKSGGRRGRRGGGRRR